MCSKVGDGENTPGTVWAYNNWDINALTTIFEIRTGMSIAEAFETGISKPTGMLDHRRASKSVGHFS